MLGNATQEKLGARDDELSPSSFGMTLDTWFVPKNKVLSRSIPA